MRYWDLKLLLGTATTYSPSVRVNTIPPSVFSEWQRTSRIHILLIINNQIINCQLLMRLMQPSNNPIGRISQLQVNITNPSGLGHVYKLQ